MDISKLLDKDGVQYLWTKIKAAFALKTEIPTKTSQLTNDSGFKTTDTTYSEATTGAAGLMSAADKTKLNGIAEGAEANVNADWNATTGDAFIKNKPTGVSAFSNDANYVVDSAYVHTDNNLTDTLITKINDAGTSSFSGAYSDLTGAPTKVSAFTNDAGYQTASDVSSAISTAIASAVTYKGSVDTSSDLPSTATVGDMYNISDTGMNAVYNGASWDEMAPTYDLTVFVKTADLGTVTNSELDEICV